MGDSPRLFGWGDSGLVLASSAHADVAQLVEHHLAKVRVAGSNPVVRSRMSVEIQTGGGVLLGELEVPADRPLGVIVFAHGSGSSRLSPRNQMVAAALR